MKNEKLKNEKMKYGKRKTAKEILTYDGCHLNR